MTSRLARIAALFDSLSLRLVILLSLGIGIASSVSLFVADAAHQRDFERLRLESVAASVGDIVNRLRQDEGQTNRLMAHDLILGARPASPGARIDHPSPRLAALLRAKVGPGAAGQPQPSRYCFPGHFAIDERAFEVPEIEPNCWLIRIKDTHGQDRYLSIGLPRYLALRRGGNLIVLPIVLAGAIALSIVTAYFVTKPLRRLTRAAEAFSLSEEPEPLPEHGPREVRTAIATFNLMQRRVSDGHRERTSMLASISHDLQTPLTRLRLRLEEVADPALRARLIGDLSGTQSLVREGLNLARSSENSEPWSIVDIDSLIASIATDAAELGADVTMVAQSRAAVLTKLDALNRCVSNLVDNAVKYAGSARIGCRVRDGMVEVGIRDFGPGIPEEAIERMFQPFVRGGCPQSTRGTGIGLTIARAQAKLFRGEVVLRNHPAGGLVATVSLPMARPSDHAGQGARG